MLDRVNGLLPYLYFGWAVPFLLILSWVVPPWQNPDESNHMLRAVQVSYGGLVGRRFGGGAGGSSDFAVLNSSRPFAGLYGNPDRKVANGEFEEANTAWSEPRDVYYPNTARYPPFFYVPAALSVAAGREAGLSVSGTLRLARMVNALCAAMLGGIALRIAQASRLLVASILILPMTLNLSAAVGQDGLIISATCACVAAIDYLAGRSRSATPLEIGGISLALLLIATAMPPLIAIAALPLMLKGRDWMLASIAIAIAMVVCVWSVFVAATISVPMHGANPSAQLSYMFHNPSRLPSLAVETLRIHGDGYWHQFVGQLGSLDVSLPDAYVWIATGVLALVFLSSGTPHLKSRWLVALIVPISAAFIFLALYLTWTSPGAGDVEGVQGRYFLPLAVLMAVLAPNIRPFETFLRPVAVVAVLVFAMVTPMIVLRALIIRYYLT